MLGYRTALVVLTARLVRPLVLVLLVTRCLSREEAGGGAALVRSSRTSSDRRVVTPRRS